MQKNASRKQVTEVVISFAHPIIIYPNSFFQTVVFNCWEYSK